MTDSTAPVPVVGVGPGDQAHLTPECREILASADVVVGFASVLEYVADVVGERAMTCGYDDEAETLAAFADAVADGATGAAAAMGDPSVSGTQFVEKVERAVDRPVRIVPGISSIQVAAARVRAPLEETTFVTLHRRGPIADDLARLVRDVGRRNLAVLPRPYDWMPGDVAAHLLAEGGGANPAADVGASVEAESNGDHEAGTLANLEAVVLERLTHDDETVTRTTLDELAEHAGSGADGPFSDLSVLVVTDDVRATDRGEPPTSGMNRR